MMSGGKVMFVNDEKWTKKNIPREIKLPRSIQIEERQPVMIAK
jgi:hypothetical protein